MTGIRGLSLGAAGPNSRLGGPGKQHYPVTVALLLLPACLSLAGPERAAEAHGPSLSWPAHCQGSAFRGMYGQDGTLHFSHTGKGKAELWEPGRACRLFLNPGRTTSCCLRVEAAEPWEVKLLRRWRSGGECYVFLVYCWFDLCEETCCRTVLTEESFKCSLFTRAATFRKTPEGTNRQEFIYITLQYLNDHDYWILCDEYYNNSAIQQFVDKHLVWVWWTVSWVCVSTWWQ